MNRPSMEDGHIRMPEEEFEELLELAAERGANERTADEIHIIGRIRWFAREM